MGPLTESMTRLCGEIVALRGARLGFVRDLGREVAAMKAGFRKAHREMARRTKAERQGFVESLGHEVSNLRAGFRQSHQEMAHQTRTERRASVKHLQKTVGAMRREFILDLAGAHRVWFGPSPAELRAQAEAERRAKAEAEQRAREEEAERQRLAAEAKAKEEAGRLHPAPREEAGRPGKKKG
jgi:hypothetical protein